nr:MAG TPA: hypothetical protein [Caudoviricetes sp.]
MSGDVEHLYATQGKANISRKVRQLVYDRMLMPEKDGGRKYVLCFSNSLIMPSIVKYLALDGFLPRDI